MTDLLTAGEPTGPKVDVPPVGNNGQQNAGQDGAAPKVKSEKERKSPPKGNYIPHHIHYHFVLLTGLCLL